MAIDEPELDPHYSIKLNKNTKLLPKTRKHIRFQIIHTQVNAITFKLEICAQSISVLSTNCTMIKYNNYTTLK